ncbi:acyl-CoA thioesterase [Thiotrichales bacterium 19S11-10]|nr:acyl-CoA thioesterase [Thiotrichales bacterium 19S11-10]MCF6807463.1 acyl-CoA thioesterase [Thiotrichales bacterium 19S9-11]MCF6811432.1 acyl-CoA thioesterase [Thiotrichales bacterium 19S9-12]
MKQFSIKLPIRWMDMDAYGHVNNGRYCDLMVETRFHWFNQIKDLHQWVDQEQVQFVMVKQTIEYFKPITFPAEVNVLQKVNSIGRSSIKLDYDLSLASDPTSYAKADAVLVAYSMKTKASILIPDKIKSVIM